MTARRYIAALSTILSTTAAAQAATIEPVVMLDRAKIAACGVRIHTDAGQHPIAAAEIRLWRAADTTVLTLSVPPTSDMRDTLSDFTFATASYISGELFPPPSPLDDGRLETRTHLNAFTGADLMREMMVTGARITAVSGDGAAHELQLTPPIPYSVRQACLNCAGDLVRPGRAGEKGEVPL